MLKQVLVTGYKSKLRQSIQTTLQSANYQVRSAQNGLDTLDKLELYQPHIILADYDMPDMTGDVLCQIIRRIPKFSALPVILFSTDSNIPSETESSYRGADDHIISPFSRDDLLSRVAACLSQRTAQPHTIQDQTDRIRISLLNTISHELRTPLSVIIGFVQLLLEDAPMELTTQREFLQSIYGAVLRLSNVVENLIFLSQAQSGLLNDQKNTFSIETLLTELAYQYQNKTTGEITLNLPPDPLPSLTADHRLVNKALAHLMDNALKFIQKGQTALVTISAIATDQEVQISVQDNGIGLNDTLIEHIFEPFYQADGSAVRAYGGAGAGLQIVQVIANMHGGRIEVSSQMGQGSIFTLVLPLTPL